MVDVETSRGVSGLVFLFPTLKELSNVAKRRKRGAKQKHPINNLRDPFKQSHQAEAFK
jgi:hypothetical protein